MINYKKPYGDKLKGGKMSTIIDNKKIAAMTAGELKALIREVIYEVFDPDYGLELRSEIEESLSESMRQKERGEGIPLEEARKQLGLK